VVRIFLNNDKDSYCDNDTVWTGKWVNSFRWSTLHFQTRKFGQNVRHVCIHLSECMLKASSFVPPQCKALWDTSSHPLKEMGTWDDNLTTFKCRMPKILGASTSRTRMGLPRDSFTFLHILINYSVPFSSNQYVKSDIKNTTLYKKIIRTNKETKSLSLHYLSSILGRCAV
jgi:hypothetical protein